MKRILLSILVTSAVGSTAFLATNAYFSDTETSTDNSFTAGTINLLVNGQDNPEAVVSFTDLKPGDTPEFPKTLHVDSNPAWVWLHLKDLTTSQGLQTEPEDQEEAGTPKFDLHNYLTYNLILDGQPLLPTDPPLLLPDAVSCWIPLGQLPASTDIPLLQQFSFASSVTNWAQGDTLSFTEEFYATQVRNNPSPTPPDTGTNRVWDPQLKKCVDACQEVWADGTEEHHQGTRKNGSPILVDRTNPATALVAQSAGTPYDNPVVSGSFFSLGFTNGNLVLTFTHPVKNTSGPDLKIFEVTGGTSYPDEKVKVEAWDGASWVTLANPVTRDGEVDLGGLTQAQKFRFTDVSNPASFEPEADGYDLDGLKAYCGQPVNPN